MRAQGLSYYFIWCARVHRWYVGRYTHQYFGPENGCLVGISRRGSGVVSVHVLCCKTAEQCVWWGGWDGT